MLAKPLAALLALCLLGMAYAESDDSMDSLENFGSYGTQWKFDSFPRSLRSGVDKKWANQVRFGKRSAPAGSARSWATSVRFGRR